MNWLGRAIERDVKRGVDKAIREYFDGPRLSQIVGEVLSEPRFAWFWFVKHMQTRMMQVDKTLSGKRAWEIALRTYRQYLRDEKIEFGDPRFAWNREAARVLIQAYEIDHWESAA